MCGNSDTACIRPLPGLPISVNDFRCPQCLRAAHAELPVSLDHSFCFQYPRAHKTQYKLDTHAAEYCVYQKAIGPLLLITAHEAQLKYLRNIVEAQFEQDYALVPHMVRLHYHKVLMWALKNPLPFQFFSVDLSLSPQGWIDHPTAMGRAQAWQAQNRWADMPLVIALECHSDPGSGQIAWRRTQNGIAVVGTVMQVRTVQPLRTPTNQFQSDRFYTRCSEAGGTRFRAALDSAASCF